MEFDQDYNARSNQEYFDARAATYDENSNVQAITASIVRGLLKEYAFDPEQTCVMDFACGTGEHLLSMFHAVILIAAGPNRR